ncbi:MAG: DUF4113 domain-containing protein, partial [Pricia sp.]
VMDTLGMFSPLVEEYSIDESFVDLSMYGKNELSNLAHSIKNTVHKNTGIPVGVGIAKTKSLSQLANKFAKKQKSNDNVYVVDSEAKRAYLLQQTKVKDIWGVGKKHAQRLERIQIKTALDFANMPVTWVRKEMTVIGERLWRELNGTPCLELVTEPEPKKGIGTAKSFGFKLTEYSLIEEACSYYISEVADLLRQQKSAASLIEVSLETNQHSAIDKQYRNKIKIALDAPTDSTIKLTKEALQGLKKIYRPGFRYKKVGVNLLQIVKRHEIQTDLFAKPHKSESDTITRIMDDLNSRFGKNKIKLATVGNRENQWALIKEHRSPRFTTQWKELMAIGGHLKNGV